MCTCQKLPYLSYVTIFRRVPQVVIGEHRFQSQMAAGLQNLLMMMKFLIDSLVETWQLRMFCELMYFEALTANALQLSNLEQAYSS